MELQFMNDKGEIVNVVEGQNPIKEIRIGGVVYVAQDPMEQYIDLDQEMWEMIKTAAREAKWMPEEYCMNDWVSDVCRVLHSGELRQPNEELMELVKDLKFWNESGGTLIHGSALHRAAQRQFSYMRWYEKLWFPWMRACSRAIHMTERLALKFLAETINES